MSGRKKRRTPDAPQQRKRPARKARKEKRSVGSSALPEFTGRQFAELVGVSPDTVSRWCANGMPHEVRGHANTGFVIRLDAALPWVVTYAREPPKESQRERLAREQADKVAIANAKSRNELLDAVAVGDVLRALATGVRGQLDAMDNRCAGEFAGISDPARMRERMREEHRGVCLSMGNLTRELAETCERAASDAAAVDATAAANGGSVG